MTGAVRLEPLTRETVGDALRLELAPGQETLVAPLPAWIAQCAYHAESTTYALRAGEDVVGLATLIDVRRSPDGMEDFVEGCAHVWRLMIDRRFQGRGHGRAALASLLREARRMGYAGLSLSVVDDAPGNAVAFYRACGFVETGRRVEDEREMVRYA